MPERATTEEIRLLLQYIHKGYKLPKIIIDVVFDTAVREIEEKKKIVLMKRDPDIHSRRIQGSYAKIIMDATIEVHPSTVSGYGMDFDGDTVAIFAPLSDEAQEEIRKKMITVTSTDSMNSPNFTLSKGMLTGIYTLTSENKENSPKKISTVEEAKLLHIGTIVEIKFRGKTVKTTAGRIIFNEQLPEYIPFIDEEMTGKKLKVMLTFIINKSHSDFAHTIDKLMDIGFYYTTIYPKTISLDQFKLPPKLIKLKEQLSIEKDVAKQDDIIKEMEIVLLEHLKNNVPDLYQHVISGAAKGIGQLRQIMVCKGLVQDAQGNVLPPITKAMHDGYTPGEYFDAAAGSRKGIIDRALNTAYGGYAYRQMIYVVGNVEANLNLGNCGTRTTLDMKLSPDLFKRMGGRYCLDKKGELRTVTKDMIGSVVKFRSPVFCKSRGICRTCFGDLILQLKTRNIGIVAAQEVTSLSEKIMKCSDGLVHYNKKLVSFTDLFDDNPNEIYSVDGVDSKGFSSILEGKDGPTVSQKIEKHFPDSPVLFISTTCGHTLVCQSNHPLWIKKNPLNPDLKNIKCYLHGNRVYNDNNSKIVFEVDDEELVEIEARQLKRGDSIWIDETYVKNTGNYTPEIDGYEVGMNIMKNTYNGKNKEIFDKIVLGDDKKYKRLNPDFINYNEDWLRDFLAGLFDSKGSILIEVSTAARIYINSYYLAQQVKAICLKINYKFSIALENTRLPYTVFYCALRFYNDSKEIPFKILKCNIEDVVPVCNKPKELRRGFDNVKIIRQIKRWGRPLYDVKTETKDYMINFLQNHNSFHLGGVVSINRLDMHKDLMQNVDDVYDEIVKKSVSQKDNDLICNVDMAIIKIDRTIYMDAFKITEDNDFFILPVGHFEIEVSNIKIPITIEQEIKIYKKNDSEDMIVDDKTIIIVCRKNDKMIYAEPSSVEASKVAQQLTSLVGGKSPWLDPPALYSKFYKALAPLGSWDSAYLEVILSNIFRAKKDPQLPARLKEPFDPVMFSMKKLPGINSWPLGLAFENFSSSLATGMISERAPESSIEKIMFGEPLSELAKQKR